MNRSQPFARALQMVAMIAAAMALPSIGQQQAKLAEIGPYVSRGKGQGGGNRRAPGARMSNIRAAHKARNVRRHRAANR